MTPVAVITVASIFYAGTHCLSTVNEGAFAYQIWLSYLIVLELFLDINLYNGQTNIYI